MEKLRSLPTDCALCLSFYSRLAWGPKGAGGMSGFAEALRALPLAGSLIGGAGALALGTSRSLGLSPLLAATIAVAALVALTGALHEDGLADVADGFGGGATRERKLDIMRDSRLGAFGALTLVLGLLLRIAALAQIATRSTALAAAALVATAALARTVGLAPLLMLPPARSDGAGAAMPRPSPSALSQALGFAALLSLAPTVYGAPFAQVLVADVAAVAAAIFVARLAERQIGGYTGDVLGAAQQAAEIAGLIALSAS